MNLYGIFLDNSHAYIIKSNGKEIVSMEEIQSEVESRNKGQYTDEHVTISNQHKNTERREQEFKHFFKEIIGKIADANQIMLFGPGLAKTHFKTELEKIGSFKKINIEALTTDSMTENQLKAYVKEYFEK